ncbi:MAG: toprim domain-containing protein [Proteobacteria bacterium]|nr:toprim domain-containing protein [Pseudomonadota bacterium]
MDAICQSCGKPPAASTNGAANGSAPRVVKRPDPPRTMDTGDRMYGWFAGRGISREVVEAMGVYVSGEGEHRAIVFPYTRGGQLVNNKYRTADKRFRQEKDAERTFYNIDAVSNAARVIIAEGEVDVLSLLEVGYEAVISLPDGAPATPDAKGERRYEALRTCGEEIGHVKKFVIAKDADAPGGYLADELARRLGRDRCWLVDWPTDSKDANDVLVKHGSEKVRACIEAAKPYPVSGLYTFDHFEAEIDRLYRDGHEETYSTGWPAVDQIMKVPAQRGMLWIVTGIPNGGKSEWVDALAMNLAKAHGWRTAFCSFENPPDLHAVKLLEKYLEQPFWEGPTPRMGEGDLARGKTFIADHFPLIRADDDSPTLNWLFEKMRAVVVRYGVRIIVADPYNELEHQRPNGMTETEYVSDMLGRMRRFAYAHGCQMILVAHPAKLRRREDGSLPTPGLYDISGSANFANKADFGIIVHRDLKTGRTTISVRKCRFKHLGKIGDVELEYDVPTGCYRPYRKAGLS